MKMKPSTKTILRYLEELAEGKPDFPLYRQEGERALTASEVLFQVKEKAAFLRERGIGKKTLLVVRTEKSVDAVLFLYALFSLGAVSILADPHEDLQTVSQKKLYGQAAWYLTGEKGSWELVPLHSRAGLQKDSPESEEKRPVSPEEKGTGQKDPESPEGAIPEEAASRRPALMIHTSGSTGESKLVILSQYNIINNLTDAAAFGDYREGDRALGLLPLTHVFGLLLLFGSVILPYGIVFPARMDPDSLLACIQNYRISRINCVPTLLLAMAKKCDGYDLSSLRVGFLGGSPCTKEQFDFMEARLGMTLLSAYGMSECPSISISSPQDPPEARRTTVGKSYQMTRIRITDRNFRELACGQTGEICVSSPTCMLGYYREGMTGDRTGAEEGLLSAEKSDISDAGDFLHTGNSGCPEPAGFSPAENPDFPDTDGFLPTGDLGFLDEKGYLHITGRIKDIIIRNGVNISALKIEEAMLSLPGVQEAAVISVPDDKTGEIPAAVYAGSADPSKIRELLKEKLTKNEWPEMIKKISSLPHTSSGKIDKPAIKKLF